MNGRDLPIGNFNIAQRKVVNHKLLAVLIQKWREQSNHRLIGGYPEACAANAAEADIYERCADELEAILTKES